MQRHDLSNLVLPSCVVLETPQIPIQISTVLRCLQSELLGSVLSQGKSGLRTDIHNY